MPSSRIWVVDDDAVLRGLVTPWLRKAGHNVKAFASAAALEKTLQKQRPDLLLLDVLLANSDGIEICQRLKQNRLTQAIRIILISGGRIENDQQALGLISGADDYLIKPLNPLVLNAKIEAVMRRSMTTPALQAPMERHGIRMDLGERRVQAGRNPIELTRKEFDLAAHLLAHPNQVFSPKQLLEIVWGYETEVYNNPHTVEVHIYQLRKKLGQRFADHLVNVIGSGYRLE